MLTGRAGGCRRPDQGSVLMLVPAAVLVLFVLGSIAVDAAIAFLAQRELTSLAAAAANDAAGAAVSDPAFYRGSGDPSDPIVLNEAAAKGFARASLDTRRPSGVTLDAPAEVQVDGDQVCVRVTGRVEYIFAKAIPGASSGRTVTGRAVATAVKAGVTAGERARPAGICL